MNYIEQLLLLVSATTGCAPVSSLAVLVVIPTVILSSAVGLKTCTITALIKHYTLLIKKKTL